MGSNRIHHASRYAFKGFIPLVLNELGLVVNRGFVEDVFVLLLGSVKTLLSGCQESFITLLGVALLSLCLDGQLISVYVPIKIFKPLIRQSLECRDLLDDAKRFHLRPDLRHEMRDRRYRPRDSGDECLVVIGGFGSDQNPSDSVEMFNPRMPEWSELPVGCCSCVNDICAIHQNNYPSIHHRYGDLAATVGPIKSDCGTTQWLKRSIFFLMEYRHTL